MGITHTTKENRRQSRLRKLPRLERLAKMAQLKKKQRRILNSDENHALLMNSEQGQLLRLHENIRQKRATNRSESIDAVLGIIETEFHKYCRSSKVSRVIQSCIKYATKSQLLRIYNLLLHPNSVKPGEGLEMRSEDAFLPTSLSDSIFSSLTQDTCAVHVFGALVRHSTHALYLSLYKCFLPRIHLLARSTAGAGLLDILYRSTYCSAEKKNYLICGIILGSETALSDRLGNKPMSKGKIIDDMTGMQLTNTKHGVPKDKEILFFSQKMTREQFESLMHCCDSSLSKAKSENKIVYEICYIALELAEQFQEQQWRKELLLALRPRLLECASISRTASILSSNYFCECSPKERRAFLQNICPHVVEFVSSFHGAPFISSLIAQQKDHQVALKNILKPITDNMDRLISDDSLFRHFGKFLLNILRQIFKANILFDTWRQYPLGSGDPEVISRYSYAASIVLPSFLTTLKKQSAESFVNAGNMRQILEFLKKKLTLNDKMQFSTELYHILFELSEWLKALDSKLVA